MKPIFIKELRENGAWATLMFAAMAAAFACGINSDNLRRHSLDAWLVLPVITRAGFPAVGFVLGLLQILQDASSGRWSFLTHRPISRGKILSGKILAGAFLYFLVTLIPLFLAEILVALPGDVSASLLGSLIPRLIESLGGMMWYAAGLLVAARCASWIGSRLMPAGMALVGSYLAFEYAKTVAESLLAIALTLSLILLAAWGVFSSGGNLGGKRIAARLAASLCVFVGLYCTLAGLGDFWKTAFSSYIRPDPDPDFGAYRIAEDGRILIYRYPTGEGAFTTNLQGIRLPPESARFNKNGINVSLDAYQWQWLSREQFEFGNRLQNHTIDVHAVGNTETEYWYYIASRKTIEGFNYKTRRLVGTIGPGGFVQPSQNPEPFPEPLFAALSPSVGIAFIASARTAYQLNLAGRTIVPIFIAKASDPIVAIGCASPYLSPEPDTTTSVIVTKNEVHFFEFQKEIFHTQFNYARSKVDQLQVYPASDGNYVLVYRNGFWPNEPWSWVDKADDQGRILEQTALPQLLRIGPHPLWVFIPRLAALPPLAYLWNRMQFTHHAVLFRPAEMIPILFVAICALCATAFILRRRGFSRRAMFAWSLVNALLGFPGVLLVISLIDRIAKVPCPSCGRRRLVTRLRCEHCNALFLPPVAQGIEVFAAGQDNDHLIPAAYRG